MTRKNERNQKATQSSAGAGDTLQQALLDGMARIPNLFMERMVVEKLHAQQIRLPKRTIDNFVEHILSGSSLPFVDGNGTKQIINLRLDNQDIQELVDSTNRFRNEQLTALIPKIANKIAKSTLRHLKATWIQESSLQTRDLFGFRERMEIRWGKPLGQLRMLLTMVREWSGTISRRKYRRSRERLLIRLVTRACQVSDEIICLLENGFADGAMARWRTLHEIAVISTVIRSGDGDLIKRYIDHQYVESKRAMDKYVITASKLGYRPLTHRSQANIQAAYDNVIAKYGKNFKTDYGWAALHLSKDGPTFADLEISAGRSHMRSYYQMGNDNIHAGIKSMYVRLGLLGNSDALLPGRSNAGLSEPGQNTAITLAQLAVMICSSNPVLDDLVIGEMIVSLSDEIPRSFARVDAELEREEKEIRAAFRGRKKSPAS